MADDKVQRIKLRCEGSPVKYDATILESSRDGKRIKVRFDGPMEDTVMVSISDRKLASDMKDMQGRETDVWPLACSSLVWEVL